MKRSASITLSAWSTLAACPCPTCAALWSSCQPACSPTSLKSRSASNGNVEVMTELLNRNNRDLPANLQRRHLQLPRIAIQFFIGIFVFPLLLSPLRELFANASDTTPVGLWKSIDD